MQVKRPKQQAVDRARPPSDEPRKTVRVTMEGVPKTPTSQQAHDEHQVASSPQENTVQGRMESPHQATSFERGLVDSTLAHHQVASSLTGIPAADASSTPVTSVVRSSHYQNQQVRLVFKTPLITSPQPAPKSPLKSDWKLPNPPDIRALGEYQVVKTIGSGSTGKVQMAVHATTKERVALKSIVRTRKGMDPPKNSKESTIQREKRIFREASILYLLKHPHIVSLHDFFVCDEYFCMVFEFVEGVQLLDYITGNGKLKEKAARKFMRQMVSAIDYCHQNSVAHRDLKIENMLVDLNGNIKIIDFGLSNFYDPKEQLKTFCGSLYFAAPELLKGLAYTGPEVDVWALGVVLYVMVCGRVPFDDKSLPALHEKIKRGEFHTPSHVSPECADLIRKMISPDPRKRASMSEVINHAWLNQGFNFTVRNFFNERVPLDSVDPRILDFLTKEFKVIYTQEKLVEVLDSACEEWGTYKDHPVVSLYYLVRDRLIREGVLVPPSILRPLGTRSPSCPELAIPVPENAAKKHDFSSAQRTRNLAISVGNRSPVNGLRGAPRPRSKSMAASVPSLLQSQPSAPITDHGFEVKTVYLKGLFSINSTSKRSPQELRQDVAKVLSGDAIKFDNVGAVFSCEYSPSVDPREVGKWCTDGDTTKIGFEIHIVRVAVFGQYGVLFKRIFGDINLYKTLCTQILSQLDL